MEFVTESGPWVANFRPGLAGIHMADVHPNGRDALVIASGDLWVVNPVRKTAEYVLPVIDSAFEVQNPGGWVFTRQGIALVRLGPDGIRWHTKRLSWDGFDRLRIDSERVSGFAWSLDSEWVPFEVELATGRSTGGSFSDDDAEGWEQLAN
ncbi:hypothetical protein [Roseateles sp. P5_D6]